MEIRPLDLNNFIGKEPRFRRIILFLLLKNRIIFKRLLFLLPQELEVRALHHLYSLKTKSSQCHYVVMTRSETKLSVAIPAPVSGQLAVNVATARSKCSIAFFYLMIQIATLRQNRTMSQIYFKSILYRETYF